MAASPKAAVDQALDRLQKLFPNEFRAATSKPADLEKIKSAAESAASEILKMIQNAKAKKSPEQCLSHLPTDRINRIKGSLMFKTYRMTIGADLVVRFMMGGEGAVQIGGLPADINVGQQAGANRAYYYQAASILLESLIFLLILLGIPLDSSAAKNADLLKEIIEKLEKSRETLEHLQNMVDNYHAGNTMKVIEGMLGIVATLFDENLIAPIVKLCIGDKGPLDFLSCLARLLAWLTLFGGAADLLAKIFSLIADASDFLSKLKTMREILQHRGR